MQLCGAPHLRSAAQIVSPVLATVKRFVPTLWSWWHPYTSRQLTRSAGPYVSRCGYIKI